MRGTTVDEVREALQRLFVAADGTRLRREDEKKAVEVAAMLDALRPRLRARGRCVVVDAAGGKGAVGLLAAELLGVTELVVIDRDPTRTAACVDAATRLSRAVKLDARTADVRDEAAWPSRVDVTVALHACGEASDAVLDGAVARASRWLLVVPCCYAGVVPFAATARAMVEAMGAPAHAAVRRPMVQSLIDAERTLRLEAAGYEVTVTPFVAPTVTPHNLLWTARRVMEPRAMRAAAARLATLRAYACTRQ